MKLHTFVVRALAGALALCACAPPLAPADAEPAPGVSLFARAPEQQWRLPDRLREISGLAVAPDGRLFGHDDETAVIYEIDPVRGRLVKAFSVGTPAETGDFEGLAITASGEFWLVTSRGRLLRFHEGADGAHVAFERFDTGLRDICEIEGLAFLAAEESLILACKRNEARAMRNTISLYRWREGAAAAPWLTVPERAVAGAAGLRAFHPSAIALDQGSGRVLVLSADDPGLAELSADGAVLSARALGESHVQPEGLEVLPDGVLVISDEADGGQALLSRYARAR